MIPHLNEVSTGETSTNHTPYNFFEGNNTNTLYDIIPQSNKYVLWSFTSFSAPVQKKKKYHDTETDPEKLCNNLCGGNIYVEGEDPKLGPDSDYPKWLWELRTEGKPVPFEELEPDTWEYWRRVRKNARKRKNFLMKTYKRWKSCSMQFCLKELDSCVLS